MTDRQLLLRDLLVLFGLTGWALALPSYGSEFVVSLALTCLMYVALSSSWALFCGTTRYLSLATSAFFGVGAYAVYFVSSDQGATNMFVALGAGVALAAVCALVVGAFVCLTRGFYFIMVTLAAGQMLYSLFHDTDIAKGSDGAYIDIKPDLVIAGRTLIDFDNRIAFFYVCLVLLVLPAQGLLSGLADRSTVLRREGVARLAPLPPSRRRGGIDREGEGHLGLRTRDIHATGDNPDPGLVESRPHLVLEIGHRVDGRKLLLFGRRFLGLGGRLRLASL